MKRFLKNQLANKNRIFYSKHHYETKTTPFMAFRLLESQECSIYSRKCNFELIFFFIENSLI